MWTKKQSSLSRNSTKSGVDQKKGLHLKKCTNFHEFRGETTKKSAKNSSYEFCGDNQYLGSLRPRTVRQRHLACHFLWGTIVAWGAQFSFGGVQAVIWGGTAREYPPWRQACCKFTAIYQTATIAFLLKRCCSKSVLLQK